MSEYSRDDCLSAFERVLFSKGNHLGLTELFLSRCPIDVCLRLALLNHRLQAALKNFQDATWDLNRFLKPWFSDPGSFRSRLGECDAVITGWHALRFFDRSLMAGEEYKTDLKIVLRLDRTMKMGEELQSQGFHFIPVSRFSDLVFQTQVRSLAKTLVSQRHVYYAPYQQLPRVIQRFQFAKLLWGSGRSPDAPQTVELVVVSTNPIAHVVETSKASESFQSVYLHSH